MRASIALSVQASYRIMRMEAGSASHRDQDSWH
ncbi:unnamed protein product [Mycetohabitans rhizoxinica HKI 454]|uniref:Uncharacterized protein n=1 Tax=Mycetohabitans rhizoxinica (strain DSM 19002 / CIP 109453 / HKI 454) TaxID=882378 RepID=E5AKC3_MYCRK|nr:unnamed protein product [Mycetohabitans rhizoxinica HKI 454]